MGKNRNIDVVRKLGNWDEKKEKEKKEDMCGWEKYWDEKKKMGIEMGKREEINEKKNSVNFRNFLTTQLLTSITSTKFDVK